MVEGVTRVIDSPPAPGPLDARVPDSVTPNFQERSELKGKGGTNPDEDREGGTACPYEISGTDAAPSPQHNANSGPHPNSAGAPQSSPPGELEEAPMQPGDVPKTEASVTDLMEDLGYKPDTPIAKGIKYFIDWYKSYFGIQ